MQFENCSNVLNRGTYEKPSDEEILGVLQIMQKEAFDTKSEMFSEEDRYFLSKSISKIFNAYNQKDTILTLQPTCHELYHFLHEKFEITVEDHVPGVHLCPTSAKDVVQMSNVLNLVMKGEKVSLWKKIILFIPTFLFLSIHIENFYANYLRWRKGNKNEDFYYHNWSCNIDNESFRNKVGYFLYAFKYANKYREEVLKCKCQERFMKKKNSLITPQVLSKLNGITR